LPFSNHANISEKIRLETSDANPYANKNNNNNNAKPKQDHNMFTISNWSFLFVFYRTGWYRPINNVSRKIAHLGAFNLKCTAFRFNYAWYPRTINWLCSRDTRIFSVELKQQVLGWKRRNRKELEK